MCVYIASVSCLLALVLAHQTTSSCSLRIVYRRIRCREDSFNVSRIAARDAGGKMRSWQVSTWSKCGCPWLNQTAGTLSTGVWSLESRRPRKGWNGLVDRQLRLFVLSAFSSDAKVVDFSRWARNPEARGENSPVDGRTQLGSDSLSVISSWNDW